MSSSRFLRVFLLLLVFVVAFTTANEEGECENPGECNVIVEEEEVVVIEEDPNCPSRPHIIRCAAAYLDENHNGKLERKELSDAINKLPWYSRGVLKILGSVDKIMKKVT